MKEIRICDRDSDRVVLEAVMEGVNSLIRAKNEESAPSASHNIPKLSASQINIALKAMEYDEHRISFISECMAGICEHCGQVTDKCYCMCDD